MEVKKSQIVAISGGEYSDYYVKDYVRALIDFDTKEVSARFVASDQYKTVPEYDPKGDPTEYGSDKRVLAWMIREGIVEPVEAGLIVEWWTGGYSTFEPMHENNFTPRYSDD